MDFYLRTRKDPNNSSHEGKPPTFWGQGENDLAIESNGDISLVQGVECLKQSMAKILVTDAGANTFFPAYGAGLQDLIGQKMDIDYLRAQIKLEIIDALRIYQYINKNNPDLDEQIETLTAIRIRNVYIDGFDVSFNVITRAGNSVSSLVLPVGN